MLPSALAVRVVLAHEIFLRMIRVDPELQGITIHDKDGNLNTGPLPAELRELAFADDTGVGIKDDPNLPALAPSSTHTATRPEH